MDNSIYRKGLAVVLIMALIIMTFIGVKIAGREISTNESGNVINDEGHNQELKTEDMGQKIGFADIKDKSPIFVDVDGAVKNPGVYELTQGDRVNDAIDKAGGLSEDAYTRSLNKARLLVDGEKIYIPDKSEQFVENNTVALYNTGEGNLININTATKEQLMALNGIGEAYAERIIDYRKKSEFSSIEEIKNVKGIGEKTFDKIKDSITTGYRP